ncbi:alpha amylase C-terminal domain-containing protein [Bacteroidales bacterium OttesenSCG-928-K22]|nr:alpha amylase C-terminal domain-containing protein [Bacteroidales bacterium OttesenSCG-928-L14]MDL2240227.1 alpha amylase C-terminal domain-containing protein [Bacteroidales bacterium OttesenSCG-928-K22]
MRSFKIVENDQYLADYSDNFLQRFDAFEQKEKELIEETSSLVDFANGYLFFGCHKTPEQWIFREWAPNATEIFLIGEHSNWKALPQFAFQQIGNYWELKVNVERLRHGYLYRLLIKWKDGEGERIPAWATRVVQDEATKIFSAQIWSPKKKYKWKYSQPENKNYHPLIYEAHIGMAQEAPRVSSFTDFKNNVLPKIVEGKYNTIQLMAIQEHPYYGSFGYHVSSFFAVSSRFGTPEELKELIDEAHKYGIKVIMDLVHSHSVKNEIEGLAKYDGTDYQFFHSGEKGNHPAWDSKCFNYGKNEVIHFLLSNCKFWLEEYKFDGFRFDGITSMLYDHHGLNRNFTSYAQYFDGSIDIDACVYLMLANKLIHQAGNNTITVAEEMSGMPGIATPIVDGGFGFDYRLAMGVPDYWIKLVKEVKDEHWDVSNIYYELTNHRSDEKSISYLESHDQAIVGDKTMIFRLIDKYMYNSMSINSKNFIVDRGIALHKIMRLITISTAGAGYLNFMGNEFGHPEWIDFPRQGNKWSYQYARRQWSLEENKSLRYYMLADFDKAMINMVTKNDIFKDDFPYKVYEHCKDEVLAFTRNGLLFVFNFNPNKSFENYKFNTLPGSYKIILNTDNTAFNGFGRIDESICHYTTFKGNKNLISLYLPARVGLVLKMEG